MSWIDDPAELRKRRLEAGLSQAELGARAGKARSVVRDVELGKIKLRGELRESLWQALARYRVEQLRADRTVRSYAEKVDAARAKYKDWDDVVTRVAPELVPPRDPKQLASWIKERTAKQANGAPFLRAISEANQEITDLKEQVSTLRVALAEHIEKTEAALEALRTVAADQGNKILVENGVQEPIKK